MSSIEIGRLLRSSTTGCVIGCRVSNIDAPAFGGMVRMDLDEQTQVFGIIYDIHIDDDGLVRQLITAEEISQEIIDDNRTNRNVPVEISVLFLGYQRNGQIFHLMPPRPPLTLGKIYLCTAAEICSFTSANQKRMGYFRHILRDNTLPVGELLSAHIQQVYQAQQETGDPGWIDSATREVITLLRDDYPTLMQVLGALADSGLYRQPLN